jgi:uncharacterized protein YqgC (DUF456 family)
MDWILITASALLMIGGIAGAVLPALPGPLMCFGALALLHLSGPVEFSWSFLGVMALITVVVTVTDFIVPAWGTKKLGGSKAGIRGATIGLLVGVFLFPPFGIIFGPPVGAIGAELIFHGDSLTRAVRSGIGSLLGFLAGTGLKLATALLMASYYVMALWN